MSKLAYLLTGKKIALADSHYMQRLDRKDHAVEAFLHGSLGFANRRFIARRRLDRFIAGVNALESRFSPLSDRQLQAEFEQISAQLRQQGLQDPVTAACFALVREAARRVLGKRHHDVQIRAGWVLLHGMIAEMATGEGKTLAATLPACIAAAAGAVVHVVTVNDYLAERDAETMQPLYAYFGFSVGVIREGMQPEERRAEYAKPICYASNKELVFDYLKDQLAIGRHPSQAHRSLQRLVQGEQKQALLLRGLHMAIVDEADSVLVDEARTPLIISATVPDANGENLYRQALDFAGGLQLDRDFFILRDKELDFSPLGKSRLAELARDACGIWASTRWREFFVAQALAALHLFQRDQHYIVVENKVQIVDEFTGRVMPDRSWEGGLHQMIEAKEGCEISGQRQTLARMTYQRFFNRYVLLAGMTGTGAEIAGELWRVYELKVVKIPTHKPCARLRLADHCHVADHRRWAAIAGRAQQLAEEGRAVLIGTRSVESSEKLSALLDENRIAHFVLNARQDKAEAEIVSQAGRPGRITVATNMAGRGTDIHLEASVAAAGGLHVILAEFNESGRVDRQLIGRCARQGDPGSAEAIVCLEDELFTRHAPLLVKLAVNLSQKNAGKVPRFLLKWLVAYAQSSIGEYHANIRIQSLKQDRKLREMLAFSGCQD